MTADALGNSRLLGLHVRNNTKLSDKQQQFVETHENCRRNAPRASRRNARVTESILRHEKWAIDDVSCRGHYRIREGIFEGFEEGQGPGPRPGGGGDGLVEGQRPPPTYLGREAAARWW
jgi:hypothetical protein